MQTRRTFGMMGLLTVFLAACQSGPPEQKDAQQAIIAQERRALDQWSNENPLGYLEIAADDITYFDDIGAYARVSGIEAMRTYLASLKGKIPSHRYEMLDPNVQVYGDLGILTMLYQAYGTDDKPLPRWKATSVYRRVEDQWRIVHAHWSLVKGGEAKSASRLQP